MKCIGFDATEDHRTFATSGGVRVCPDPELPEYNKRYLMRYPLREWGMDRAACGRTIVAAGLPLPPKSACFFCPSMKQAEIEELQREEPVLFALALEMERLYRAGKHFRGDDVYTVNAVHHQTGEKVSIELRGDNADGVRETFRWMYDDEVRPYKYRLGVSRAVVGLGRSTAWSSDGRLSLQTI